MENYSKNLYTLKPLTVLMGKADIDYRELFEKLKKPILTLVDRVNSSQSIEQFGAGYEVIKERPPSVYGPPVSVNPTLTVLPFVSGNGISQKKEILVRYHYRPEDYIPNDKKPEMEHCLTDDIRKLTGMGFYIHNGFFVLSDQIRYDKDTLKGNVSDFCARVEKVKKYLDSLFISKKRSA